MKNYPKPQLFKPSQKEIANAAQRLVKESCTENTAHSFTEGAEFNPENAGQKSLKPHSLLKLYLEHIDVTMALSKFLELHEREAAGDTTITQKEWNAAIATGRKALEKATQ